MAEFRESQPRPPDAVSTRWQRTFRDHQTPAVTAEPPGFGRARDAFRRAALEVPAYADFLRRNKVAAERIQTPQDFASVPPVTKANYLHHYPLNMLARQGDIAAAGTWSTSSGSSGQPTYWPRGSLSLEQSIDLYDTIFRQSFQSRERSTLAVIGFAMGRGRRNRQR